MLWPRLCAFPWASPAEPSAECGMFLLLFVQSNKQKNNKTPTSPSMLLCRCLEGRGRSLICSARGMSPLRSGARSCGSVLGAEGAQGTLCVLSCPWELPQSQGSAGAGSVASAAPASSQRDFRGDFQCPVSFSTCAAQRAAIDGCSRQVKHPAEPWVMDTRDRLFSQPWGCSGAARHNWGSVNWHIHHFSHRGDTGEALTAAFHLTSLCCPSLGAAERIPTPHTSRIWPHTASFHLPALPCPLLAEPTTVPSSSDSGDALSQCPHPHPDTAPSKPQRGVSAAQNFPVAPLPP